jgi:hypothetical protein
MQVVYCKILVSSYGETDVMVFDTKEKAIAQAKLSLRRREQCDEAYIDVIENYRGNNRETAIITKRPAEDFFPGEDYYLVQEHFIL